MQAESRTTSVRRLRRFDALAFAIVGSLAALLFLGGIALLPHRQAATARWVEHSLEVLGSAQGLTADVTAAIATQRRVLLEGNGEHVPRFAMRQQTILRDLAALRSLVADDPSQAAALDHLAGTIGQRIALLQTTVARVQAGRVAEALALDGAYRHAPVVALVQTEIGGFVAEERARLRQHLASAQAATRLTALALTGCVAVLIASLVTAGVQLYRRRIERAQTAILLASEATLRSTFEQAAVGMAHVALDGGWLRVNGRLCAMLGYDEAALRRRTFQELTHPDDLDADLDNVHRLLAGDIPAYSMEKRYVKRGGKIVWANLTVSLVRAADGAPAYFISVVEDISARKDAEAAALEYYRDFQTLSDNIPSLCWMARADGDIFWFNRRWYDYTGAEPNARTEWHWPSAQDAEAMLDVRARWGESLATGQPFATTFPLRGADGTYRPFLTRIVPLRDANGAVQRWFGIHVDVTEQIETERTLERLVAERTAALEASQAQLQQSEWHYRMLTEHANDTVSRIAADGTRLYVSPAGARLVGVPCEEMVGCDLLAFVHPDDRARVATLQKALLAGAIDSGTETFRFNNQQRGEVWVETSVRALRHAGSGAPDGYISVMRDITERRKLESVLQHGQKMEAIGSIAAGIAHDFNNILQSVICGLELTLDELPPSLSGAEFLRVALSAARRGAGLTQQLLSYAHKQVLRPRPVEARAFLNELATLLSRTLGPDIAVTVETAPGLPPMLADPGQLQTALLNLAINARHAMPNGGILSIAAQALPDGEAIGLHVRDSGVGMDAATLQRACEPFFSTKGLEGTGLGLSMVQGFAEQSGGRLAIASAPGQGTTVRIELPVAPVERVSAPAPAAARAGTERLHILLVDDEPDVLVTTGAFLTRSGMTVLRAGTGNEALALIGGGAAVDVVVTDYAMPGLNGADLIVEARGMRPGLPAVIISGFAEVSEPDLLPSGVRVLHKPYPREDLAAEIQRARKAAGAGQDPGALQQPDHEGQVEPAVELPADLRQRAGDLESRGRMQA